MSGIRSKNGFLALAFALLTVLSWPAHEVFAHKAADSDCQVCAVSFSPELNADCGSALLAAPENFSLSKPQAALLPAITAVSPVFYGRAPPAL